VNIQSHLPGGANMHLHSWTLRDLPPNDISISVQPFSGSPVRPTPSDNQTTKHATSVAIGRIYAMHAMPNKLSPRGQRGDMPPSAAGSSTRGGSTSVRGRVRSPHISGGRPAAGSQRAYSLGWDRQTHGQRCRLMPPPPTAGHNNITTGAA